ncbi:sugar ABC transporter permease [Cohnella endophytica]|uniref:Sugar ABC transporter permease n=1 Tax=Cohnella endophytica TaxID=2419778 RepID=A0A494Y629_9BACL|nr:ABC transporter permease subunit [Cohnella endophytica]RKP56975.1 sugar ABC transporter permease [Cohnella endophytica]
MKAVTATMNTKERSRTGRFWTTFIRNKYLYLMSLPFVLWVFVFSYYPLWGWLMAFQKFKPNGQSVFHQKWVGFDQFKTLFHDEVFYQVLRNTLAMSIMGLISGFVVAIMFALLLNEIRQMFFKRFVQTISYLPHFVSWAVATSIITRMLSSDNGVVNDILMGLGFIHEPIQFMGKGNLFWGIVTVSDLWKETGWSAIIYLAAIAGIGPELYEAAKVDGAGRIKQIWHITLPGIRSTIMILLILSIGHLINNGFEKQFLLGNNLVRDYSQVLDLYSLQYGLQMSRYSFGTAVNIFSSVVSLLLLFTANGLFKRITKESVI